MAAPAFDPLVDLAGVWTTELADKYLPLPELLPARYECVDGRLIVTPAEVVSNVYGEHRLSAILQPSAKAAGYYVMGPVNLKIARNRWIQPDITVLNAPPRTADENVWPPAELCAMVVEFVSASSVRNDKVDKPRICAEAAIPYFMRIELVPTMSHAAAVLMKLVDGTYKPLTMAIAGQTLQADEPFPISFDPRELLF